MSGCRLVNNITRAGCQGRRSREPHPFRCLSTTTRDLRNAMMEYAGISDGESACNWPAIMTDGGAYVQLRGDGDSETFATVRDMIR